MQFPSQILSTANLFKKNNKKNNFKIIKKRCMNLWYVIYFAFKQ